MFVLWGVLGPIGMILNPRSTAKVAATQASPAAVSDNAADLRFPQLIGRYGDEKYLSELMIRALPGGIAALILVSLLTKPPPRKQVDDFFMLLKTPVGDEQKLIDAGVPIVYIGNTVPNRLEVEHPRLVHWGGFALAAAICGLILLLLWGLSRIGS